MLGKQVICIELIDLYVWMFILSVNEHCGHYFIVIACLVKPWFVSHSFLLDRFVPASYALQVFCIQWSNCVVVFQELFIWFKSLSDSRVRCEWVFVQLFPTHILSLEFVLGFCHGIAKRGDCKVEFYQPSYLLVFRPLKTQLDKSRNLAKLLLSQIN